MNITDYLLILLFAGVAGVLYILWKTKKSDSEGGNVLEENARLKAEVEQKDIKIGEITKELSSERTRKDELSGKNKGLYAEKISLKAEYDNLLKEKDRISKELSKFAAEADRKEKEFDNKVQKLDEAKSALEDERKRIRREDEEREEREKRERDRMWAEHENNVQMQLIELCKSPQYGFKTYDNKNLPNDFGGKYKPDFMIEFLDQYVVFDAKVSRSENLQNYVKNSVKTTITKINNNPKIYPMIFLVVPSDAIEALSKTYFYEKSYEVFVISPQAIPVVLSTFKKISSYELAEQMDPRDRENIVSLIAEFDYHINMRNALDILASQSGVSVLKKAGILRDDIKEEIGYKKSKMRLQQFKPTDMKTLMIDDGFQQEKINELISPKAPISDEDIDSVKPIFQENDEDSEA